MKQILVTFIIAALVGGCAVQNGNLRHADGERPNLLIMGEDSDLDTVSSNGRVFKRVLNALAKEMNSEGFNVYDEVAVTLNNFTQKRTQRSDAEITDIARSVNSVPIDVVVIFSVYSATKELNHARKLHVRVAGRLLNVGSGRRLSNFEIESPSAIAIASDCNRACELERIGLEARSLAQDLAVVLAKKLS